MMKRLRLMLADSDAEAAGARQDDAPAPWWSWSCCADDRLRERASDLARELRAGGSVVRMTGRAQPALAEEEQPQQEEVMQRVELIRQRFA